MVTTTSPAIETPEVRSGSPTIELEEQFLAGALKARKPQRIIRRFGASPNEIAAAIVERSHRKSSNR